MIFKYIYVPLVFPKKGPNSLFSIRNRWLSFGPESAGAGFSTANTSLSDSTRPKTKQHTDGLRFDTVLQAASWDHSTNEEKSIYQSICQPSRNLAVSFGIIIYDLQFFTSAKTLNPSVWTKQLPTHLLDLLLFWQSLKQLRHSERHLTRWKLFTHNHIKTIHIRPTTALTAETKPFKTEGFCCFRETVLHRKGSLFSLDWLWFERGLCFDVYFKSMCSSSKVIAICNFNIFICAFKLHLSTVMWCSICSVELCLWFREIKGLT